ncbi:MAG: mycothiol system anti-sigma-R factor [Microthrixaceae bacterium]
MSSDNCSDPTDPVGSNCAELAEQLYEYLDGELDHERLVALEAHIHRCGPCLDVTDFHMALRRVVAVKCSESMPADLKSRLVGMLERGAAESQ